MSTLTATPLVGLAAVQLVAGALPAGPAVITRTDVNGQGTVRLLPSQEPIGGALTVVDYEAALTGAISYSVDDASATTELDVPFPVLAAAGRPNLRVHIAAVTDYAENTRAATDVVRVIDRDDPIIFDAPHYLPSGQLVVWAASYADAAAAAQVARSGRVLMFRQPTHVGMDRYLKVQATGIAPASERTAVTRWTVRLDVENVATPTTPLLAAAGWDMAALLAAFPTFAAAQAAFPTFAAMTVGP